jgi:glutaredoxin 3
MYNPFIQPTKTYKPILFPDFLELTSEHENMHWHEGELELSPDVKDWKENMTPIEIANVTSILKLFTQSDVEVGKFYYEKLIPYYKNNEIRNMLGSFAAREGIHQRAYALLNDTLELPESEYQAFLEYKEMEDKVTFMQDGECVDIRSSAVCKVRSIFNEGVSLFASFSMLLNYQRTGRMTGMGTALEWSVRDETMHVTGLTDLQVAEFTYFKREYGYDIHKEIEDEVMGMAHEVYGLECLFIDLAYSEGELPNLSKANLKLFMQYIINLRLGKLGYSFPFASVTTNPLPWMSAFLNHKDLTNFFEKRNTNYSKDNFVGPWS